VPDVPSGVPEAPPWESLRETWRERLERLPFEPSQVVAAVVVVALLVAVGIGRLVSGGGPQGPPIEASLPRADATTTTVADRRGAASSGGSGGDVVVHVAGAVVRQGLYRLEAGARVDDAVAAAGGPGGDADLDRINLAAPVADGERVYVPRRGEAVADPVPASGGGGRGGATAARGARPPAPLDLNTATVEQLEELPGVGPSIARAIVDHRTRHGRFRAVDDLLDVPGIGEAKLASLRPRVRT
jgi:competence protein ComEA